MPDAAVVRRVDLRVVVVVDLESEVAGRRQPRTTSGGMIQSSPPGAQPAMADRPRERRGNTGERTPSVCGEVIE